MTGMQSLAPGDRSGHAGGWVHRLGTQTGPRALSTWGFRLKTGGAYDVLRLRGCKDWK
jgi:hypothetical protein